MKEIDSVEAIRSALYEEMLRDPKIIVIGEDVGLAGGVFACTRGLQEKFGEERVRDTPISEAAIVGAAIGCAAAGLRPVAEITFADFAMTAMDQISNQLAKMTYMFAGHIQLPVVIRLATGSRYPLHSGAAQHTQSLEALFMHIPGLKIVTFSTPYDAKGLLKTAIRDNNPVLFFEHKLVYYASRSPKIREVWPGLVMSVPETDYTIPFGVADIKRKGEDVTVIATMMMVHKALRAAEKLSEEKIEIEIVDPRTLVPFDKKTVIESVKKTGKVVVASEDNITCGVASEIMSIILEEAFDYLDAPIMRVSTPDIPIPYCPPLEGVAIPQDEDIVNAVKNLIK